MSLDRNGLEVLDDVECFRLLGEQSLGRVGLTVNGLPAILPVTYGIDGRAVVFSTVPGSKLHAVSRGDVICFEADQADPGRGEGWSVLVVGRAHEVTDPDERSAADALDIPCWPPIAADRYVRLHAELVSGRRVSPNGAAAPPG